LIWQKSLCSKVWAIFRRIVFADLVQRSPGRKRIPEIRKGGYLWALEVARSAVGARGHQDEISAVVDDVLARASSEFLENEFLKDDFVKCTSLAEGLLGDSRATTPQADGPGLVLLGTPTLQRCAS